jgi:hypothetical protein
MSGRPVKHFALRGAGGQIPDKGALASVPSQLLKVKFDNHASIGTGRNKEAAN